MAVFPGSEGSLTFRLKVAFATYRDHRWQQLPKNGIFGNLPGPAVRLQETYRKRDFPGTSHSFAHTGFIQLPQNFACGVLNGLPQNWQGGPYKESL